MRLQELPWAQKPTLGSAFNQRRTPHFSPLNVLRLVSTALCISCAAHRAALICDRECSRNSKETAFAADFGNGSRLGFLRFVMMTSRHDGGSSSHFRYWRSAGAFGTDAPLPAGQGLVTRTCTVVTGSSLRRERAIRGNCSCIYTAVVMQNPPRPFPSQRFRSSSQNRDACGPSYAEWTYADPRRGPPPLCHSRFF